MRLHFSANVFHFLCQCVSLQKYQAQIISSRSVARVGCISEASYTKNNQINRGKKNMNGA